MFNKILKITIGISLIVGTVNATNNNTVADETPQRWWQKGSYEYAETSKLLTHIEGNIMYSEKSGNDEDKTLKSSVLAKVRKGHFGVAMSYSKTIEDRKAYDEKGTTPSTTEKDDYTLNTVIGYDINKDFYLNAGYENSRNLAFEIYNQTTQYIGFGYRVLTLDTHKVNIFLAKGTDDISFGTYPMLPSGKTNGTYYQANYLWLMNPKFNFSIKYMLLKADIKDRDTSTMMAKASVALIQNIYFVIGYMDEYIEAQKTVNRYEHDKTFFTSIKFEF